MELFDPVHQNINLDYFILSSGSDGRAYQTLSELLKINRNVNVIIFHFKERLAGKSATDPLFRYKRLKIPNLNEIYCEIKNPSSILKEIEKYNFNSKKLGVDISCFTKPYFYFFIKLMKERFRLDYVNTYYTEPKSYYFPGGLYNAFHSTSGPLTIIEIPGYAGYEIRGSKRKLVILLGFDGDLSKEINEDISPNETVVVNGFPSYSPKFKDISLVTNERLVSNHNIEIRYARANNPFEVYNLLESIKTSSSDEIFLNIAPLGTKPMALGACLFALHNPNVRVVYPLPETYDDKYSEKFWRTWVYKLPLTI
jgi:hypothetical protein